MYYSVYLIVFEVLHLSLLIYTHISFFFNQLIKPILFLISKDFSRSCLAISITCVSRGDNVEIYSTGFHLNTDGSVTASSGQIAGWNITGANINKNQVYLDSNAQALLVKNSTGAKNIVTVGGGAMSSTTGQSNQSINGGFESDAASINLITNGDGSAHWSSRRVIHSSMSVQETNTSIELFVTNSSPYVGNRHYRVQLKN